MKALWERWRTRLLIFLGWYRVVEPVPAQPEPEPVPDAPRPKAEPRPKANGHADSEDSGVWYFRRNLLDQLDNYFTVIHRMKRSDPDGYNLYSRVGAVLTPMSLENRLAAEDAFLPGGLRNFGALFLNACVEDDRWQYNHFMYFHKFERSPYIQACDGQLFVCNLMYIGSEKNKKTRMPFVASFGVAVQDGQAAMVRCRYETTQVLRHRYAPERRRANTPVSHLQHTSWTYPPWLSFLAKENGFTAASCKDQLLKAFRWTYFASVAAEGNLRIQVTDASGAVAVFSIDLLRTPYFFRDRQHSLDDHGRRIFHIVRVHQRSSGSFVRSHFRGQRDFIWHGRRVHITMPGKHHRPLNELDFGMFDGGDPTRPRRLGDMDHLGRQLQRLLRQ